MIPISFLLFMALDHWISGDDSTERALHTLFSSGSPWNVASAAIFVAAAGVPIGFMIYQIYFYVRWNSPMASGGLFPPFIHGRSREIQSIVDLLKDEARGEESGIWLGADWRKKTYEESMGSHQERWNYISWLIRESLTSLPNRDSVSAYNRYLIDVLHGLGASLIGFLIGYTLYLIQGRPSPLYYFVSVVMLVVTVVLIHWDQSICEYRFKHPSISSDRESTTIDKLRFSLVRHPAELTLLCCWILATLLSPGIETLACTSSIPGSLSSQSLLFSALRGCRTLVTTPCVLLGVMWVWRQRLSTAQMLTAADQLSARTTDVSEAQPANTVRVAHRCLVAARREIRTMWESTYMTSLFAFLVVFHLAMNPVVRYYSQDRDWRVIPSMLVASSILLAIVKNRNNVLGTLLSLQKYHLRAHIAASTVIPTPRTDVQ